MRAIIFLVSLFVCSQLAAQQQFASGEETVYETHITMGFNIKYNSPYQYLAGNPYRDKIISIRYENLDGDFNIKDDTIITVEFGRGVYDLNELNKDELIKVIKFINESYQNVKTN